ncbi:MAG TPA: NAD-dependent epimerase/dehydratase family protein [Acidimicrobiales bacterium]
MSTIAVIGVTGYVGGHITAEALRRGHDVMGISRTTTPDSRPGLTFMSGSIADPALVRTVAERSSTLVVAVHAAVDDTTSLAQLVPSLLETVGDFGTRIGFVGGAGSLLVSPDGPRLVDTPDFPPAFQATAKALIEVLEALKSSNSSADWFYVSPAAGFGAFAPGEPTGNYRTSDNILLIDAEGNSFISGADYAVAFLDEIEKPTHHRQAFGVAY